VRDHGAKMANGRSVVAFHLLVSLLDDIRIVFCAVD
jgi:hypothetical protein